MLVAHCDLVARPFVNRLFRISIIKQEILKVHRDTAESD